LEAISIHFVAPFRAKRCSHGPVAQAGVAFNARLNKKPLFQHE
jgi:hypothetical protein